MISPLPFIPAPSSPTQAAYAATLARQIEARWHALGHTSVKVWTSPRRTKLHWVGRDGTEHDNEFHTYEICSNLINGLPPRASQRDEVPKL